MRLSAARPGDRGVIVSVGADTHPDAHGVDSDELLRRLLEESASVVQQVVIDPEGDFVTLAKPFGHESQMVSQQVERMYVGFQYQDRISQMMALLHDDMQRLQALLAAPGADAAALDQDAWMARLESRCAMESQRHAHVGGAAAHSGTQQTVFF